MLEKSAPSAGTRRRGLVFGALRLLVGYILAIAAGALVGAVTVALVPSLHFIPDPSPAGRLADVMNTALLYFTMGGIFGLPYTIVGTFVFWRWLPKKAWLFLGIGMLCPAAAVIATFGFMAGISWLDAEAFGFMAITIPAGFVAAYVYGAIGMGYGFGRWRLA